jgi:hypothetical protein
MISGRGVCVVIDGGKIFFCSLMRSGRIVSVDPQIHTKKVLPDCRVQGSVPVTFMKNRIKTVYGCTIIGSHKV